MGRQDRPDAEKTGAGDEANRARARSLRRSSFAGGRHRHRRDDGAHHRGRSPEGAFLEPDRRHARNHRSLLHGCARLPAAGAGHDGRGPYQGGAVHPADELARNSPARDSHRARRCALCRGDRAAPSFFPGTPGWKSATENRQRQAKLRVRLPCRNRGGDGNGRRVRRASGRDRTLWPRRRYGRSGPHAPAGSGASRACSRRGSGGRPAPHG